MPTQNNGSGVAQNIPKPLQKIIAIGVFPGNLPALDPSNDNVMQRSMVLIWLCVACNSMSRETVATGTHMRVRKLLVSSAPCRVCLHDLLCLCLYGRQS